MIGQGINYGCFWVVFEGPKNVNNNCQIVGWVFEGTRHEKMFDFWVGVWSGWVLGVSLKTKKSASTWRNLKIVEFFWADSGRTRLGDPKILDSWVRAWRPQVIEKANNYGFSVKHIYLITRTGVREIFSNGFHLVEHLF